MILHYAAMYEIHDESVAVYGYRVRPDWGHDRRVSPPLQQVIRWYWPFPTVDLP